MSIVIYVRNKMVSQDPFRAIHSLFMQVSFSSKGSFVENWAFFFWSISTFVVM